MHKKNHLSFHSFWIIDMQWNSTKIKTLQYIVELMFHVMPALDNTIKKIMRVLIYIRGILKYSKINSHTNELDYWTEYFYFLFFCQRRTFLLLFHVLMSHFIKIDEFLQYNKITNVGNFSIN